MRLHSKIILIIVPIVFVSILGLGIWSYKIVQTNSFNSIYYLLETTMNMGIFHEIESREKLLKTSKMVNLDFFVTHYQQEALCNLEENAEKIDKGHIFVLDHKGKFIFSSLGHTKKKMESFWAEKARRVAGTNTHINGHLESAPYNTLYTGRYFAPWKWAVFFSIDDDELIQSIKKNTGDCLNYCYWC